ncbi:MAG: ATP-binding cassette domain-containing protein [Bacilli bacterium]|nr:ATP-binding cassette domain-containing protein [Bacilli bacterium]
MLKVENIQKTYGNLVAVNQLSFEVKDGEIFGLLGENGAGKTTTFRMIMGLLESDSGKILLDNKKIDYSITDKIGFVTEERSLLTKMTVKEQILYYGALKGMSEEKILQELKYWLNKFEIKKYENKKIKELSKGNQQKIQFISAVINHPKLLILDEPFTGLDPINVKLLKEAVYELKGEGCSIIFSSHQMEHIEEFCEKLIILVKGEVILEGYLKNIKKSYGIKKVVIKGENIDMTKIEKIESVEDIKNMNGEIIVHISDEKAVEKIFNVIKKCKILKFEALEPSLNEIFIEKVGNSHE